VKLDFKPIRAVNITNREEEEEEEEEERGVMRKK